VAISRRGLIIGWSALGAAVGLGGWGLLANERAVPGRSVLDTVFGRCHIDTPPPAEATPGRTLRSSFYSRKRARSVNYMLGFPPGVAVDAVLPVCLCLHGYGENERALFDPLGYHRLLAAAVKANVPPFVLASVDGGGGYWHPHPGDDPLGMLTTEFPVILAQHGLPVDRFALLGWSMGGFGALLAATEHPATCAAVAANSPALFSSYGDAHRVNPGAFSSEEEWNTWGDLPKRVGRLRDTKLRIDCGESDPFEPAVSDLRGQLPDPSVVHIAKGCHDAAFWRSLAPLQLSMIGEALSAPKTT
jgi:enterochelin esterase-like enzyme